jgi:molybdopterin-containing oxidoreductase family membrane subunit
MTRSLEVVSNLTVLMLAVALFFTIWRMVSMGVAGTAQLTALNAMISGPFAFNFWGLEIAVGIVIPFILLLLGKGRRLWLMFTASAFIIFSVFFVRFDLVVIGQIVPYYIDLGVQEYSRLNTYMPTWHEGLVVLGGIGFCMLAFLLAEKIFDGYSESGHDDAAPEAAAPDRAEVVS